MPAKKQIPKSMILSAALKLLKEHGYEAVTIKQLAKELGCSTQAHLSVVFRHGGTAQ